MVADAVLTKANAPIPVLPVNTSVQDSTALESSPSVVNHVSPLLQAGLLPVANEGEPTYTSAPDPVRRSASSQQVPHDWALKRPAAEKVEDPPKKPISQMLMDNLKSIWTASASAVQVQQIGNQIARPTAPEPAQVPGDLAKQVLTYQPSKIKKNERL